MRRCRSPVFTVVAAVTSFACGAVVVGFAFAKESVPVQFLGTISGAVNVGNMLGPDAPAAGDRPGAGSALVRRAGGGARVYSVEAFQTAFVMIVAWAVLSCLLIAFTRETRCRQTALNGDQA